MSGKRSFISLSLSASKKRKNEEHTTYFQRTLQECGLILKKPSEKCEATRDTVYIVRDLKKSLKQNDDYPHNIETFISEFVNACKENETFEYYLFLNIVRKVNDKTYNVGDSVIKLLLNVSFLQTKLVTFIFDKLMDVLDQPEFGPWVKMTLKSFSNLDTVESSEELSKKLIDLLDVSSDKFVRLEIISAIPDIIGDREHDNVASELSRILSNESYLIPSILDCLTNLCLSDLQFERLQKETLNLMKPSNAEHFSNFVKFLLTPGRLTDSAYEETIQDLRKELGWSSVICPEEVIATSQILTAKEIRNSMLSSKAVAKAWLKVISSCATHTDHKPIDIIFFLIIASLSDEKQKLVENVMRKQIKLQILKEELLDDAFKTFKPILKKHIMTLISLANSLLKPGAEPSVEDFGAHMHMVMFSQLTECRPLIVNELLQFVLNCKQSALNTLNILNNITSDNLPIMKLQSSQMLILLDRLDDMNISEIKAVMNLVCGLAYSFEDSDIRDELHIIIRKELGSSISAIKNQGILAGVHAVKYLMKSTDKEAQIPDDVTLNMTSCFPDGDLREAAQIIELIHDSTAHFPNMLAFFYDELYTIIYQAKVINESFLLWLTSALTNYWQENFLVDKIEKEFIDDIRLSMQLGLNDPSEVDEVWGVNIAGLELEDSKEINIEVLSSLFQLVRVLHYKKHEGNLSDIDALLGSPIVMPIVDVDEISDLSESSTKKILKCYILCVNWIRELLNAFVSQEDDVLKPKILSRIAQLRDLEKTIEKIRDRGKKPEHDDTTIAGTTKSQQTQTTQIAKTKHAAINNIQYRPLDLNLIHVIQYDLTPSHMSDTEITFEILTYLLSYINVGLEKVLIPQIKKKTYLNKDTIQVYNYSEAEKQALTINKILPKLMMHVDLAVNFLDCHVVEEGSVDLETLDVLHVMESLFCLEHIYDLLTIYFRWIEFKNRNVPLLKTSLQIVAKVEDDNIELEELLTTVAKAFQKHEKHMITISSAASLMQFMKALQELSTGPEVPTILKDMALKFLSKQWTTVDHQLEKGLYYNQYLDSLCKVYLGNNKLADLKDIVTSLVDEVDDLRDKTSVLQSLKSISKSNFHILFRNLGAVLCIKIKPYLNGGFTDEELIEMWKTVAYIHKLMSGIVKNLSNKYTSSSFLKQSIPILNMLLSKGFPILKITFQQNRETILDLLKDFQTSTECLQNICSQASDRVLMQKIPTMEELLTNFIMKTNSLMKANDCSEALKMFNVKRVPNPKKKSKKAHQRPVVADETVEDIDDDFPEDEKNYVDYVYVDSVGISEML